MKNIHAKKAFTLIEMMVTVAIIVVMSVVTVGSLNPAETSLSTSDGVEQIKSQLTELKSFAAAPQQERAVQYILVIQSSDATINICGTEIKKNQYLICVTDNDNLNATEDLTNDIINQNFYTIRSGQFPNNITITSSLSPTPTNTATVVIAARTFDQQLSWKGNYNYNNFVLTLTISQSTFSKVVQINLINGIVS